MKGNIGLLLPFPSMKQSVTNQNDNKNCNNIWLHFRKFLKRSELAGKLEEKTSKLPTVNYSIHTLLVI